MSINVYIVGLGLIGASLGQALSRSKDFEVYGTDIDDMAVETALVRGAIKKSAAGRALNSADIVIFAVTPKIFKQILYGYLKNLKPGALVLDIAGNKRGTSLTMQEAAAEHPALRFMATHPMAGRECWGGKNADPSLFLGASLPYVPINSDAASEELFFRFAAEAGFGACVRTTPEEHDATIAFTSQLPHVISSSYIMNPLVKAHNGFSAGSFKDLTRVARLNSPMWAELFVENRDNLIKAIEIFESRLSLLKEKLALGDETALIALLDESNAHFC